MRKVIVLVAAIAVAASVGLQMGADASKGGAQIGKTPKTSPNISPKLQCGLADMIRSSSAKDLLPVIIVMREQASREAINEASQEANKKVRREKVINILRDVAASTQGGVLEMLRREQFSGSCGSEINPLWISNVIGANVTPNLALRLAARSDVDYLAYDRPLGEDVFPTVPSDAFTAQGVECGVALMKAPDVWSLLNITGRDIVVGVIDSGVCLTHPDIKNQLWTNPGEIPNNNIDDDGNGYKDDVYGWNFESNNNNVNDTYGHGSHVSGTVAGDGTQGTQCGMAPDAKIMMTKFWNSFSSGQQSVWNCMQYGLANGAEVETASLGWPHAYNPDRKTWRQTCENVIAGGVVVIYAGGNERGYYNPPDAIRTPGDVPDVITVGATNCSDALASFSSPGPVTWTGIMPWNDWPYPPGFIKPTIAAPGVSTTSHNLCSGYTQMSGTSMATPHVAGAVALMLEANRSLSHKQVYDILRATAKDLGPAGDDNDFGMGRVNAYDAVLAAISMADNFFPLAFAVTQGTLVSGGLSDLQGSDNNYVIVAGRPLISQPLGAAGMEIETIGAQTTASKLEFSVETRASLGNISQQISLYNYQSQSWELVDTRPAATTDTVTKVTITTNASRFIDPSTKKMKAQLTMSGPGATALWNMTTDQAWWTVTP